MFRLLECRGSRAVGRCEGKLHKAQYFCSAYKQITSTVEGIMKALSSAQQSEVKAWEEEILACEHTLTLQQEPAITPGKGELSPTALCCDKLI